MFIKNHALGLLAGRTSAVSLGMQDFAPNKTLFIPALECEYVFRALTSIWCVSLHVDQIWLLVQTRDRPGRKMKVHSTICVQYTICDHSEQAWRECGRGGICAAFDVVSSRITQKFLCIPNPTS